MINPGLRFGRYEVGARLGKGGFGVVHAARDTELGRDLAIKFLKPEYLMRPAIVQRFLQEARAAAKIGHAGIVTVFECGHVEGTGLRVDGTAFIAMELLRGETLAERLLNGGKLPSGKAIAIARQLADALGAAHEAAIIHRDLKPDNVFLVPDAAIVGGERVKVLDFGVAKLAEPADQGVHTHSQMLLGTPRYMSPEQSRSAAKIDTRSDIYTLGCILFELVTARTPFDGDAGDLIVKHQTAPVPSLRTLVSVPESYERLVEQMLAKSPDARPQTMAHVASALAAMDGSYAPPPAVAPREQEEPENVTTIAHASQFRRNRMKVAFSLGALIVAGGIAIAVGMGSKAETPRDAAVVAAVAPRPAIDAAIPVDAEIAVDAATDIEIDSVQVDAGKLDPFSQKPQRVAPKPTPAEPPPTCNASTFKTRGESEYAARSYAAATSSFKQGYDCAHDAQLLARAYQSACRAGLFSDARTMFHMFPIATQQTNRALLQICMAAGIDPRK